MKKMTFYGKLFTMISICMFAACSDDDDSGTTTAGGTNGGSNSTSITFDGRNYNMSAGLIGDFGPSGLDENTHYNYDFAITDDDLVFITDTVFNESYYAPGESATISVYIELFSPDTAGFQTGTFTYIDEDDIDSAAISGNYFFSTGEIELDDDGVVMGDLDGDEFDIAGGTVIVSGTGPTSFTIDFNIQTDDGKTLSGKYSGPWIYQDFR